jgi:type 1 glutamine amidotransferase/nicotinamidase-related amidase
MASLILRRVQFIAPFLGRCVITGAINCTLLLLAAWVSAEPAGAKVQFVARSRVESSPKSGRFEVVEKPVDWDASQTAVVICDMWDKHWCERATKRVGEIAPRINAMIKVVRSKGGLIVHAPSDTMDFYKDSAARKLAQSAPAVKPPSPSKGWCSLDPAVEGKLPIDDADGGCDDEPQCKNYKAWTRQHSAIEVADGDAVTDNGQEVYNLFKQHGIKHVIVCGVHTNMCVLGRSFAIRQMVKWGFDVVLVRDLTDTMYNHRSAPFVPHDRGTDLVVAHVEKFWCPSIVSGDILGDKAPAKVVFAINEQEYHAKETLPPFAKAELERLGFKCVFMQGDKPTELSGIDALKDADVLVIYMRRSTLPDEQLNRFKSYFAAGRPVVGLRTASHAFQNWLEFDGVVLGGHYTGHYGIDAAGMTVGLADGANGEALLRGLSAGDFGSHGSLYKTAPLAKTARPFLMGRQGTNPAEAVAWTNTHNGGRVFYTSLGHPDDFTSPQFRRLLVNGILWAMDKPVPTGK